MKNIYLFALTFFTLVSAQANSITGIMATSSDGFGLRQKALLVDLNLAAAGSSQIIYNARGFDMKGCPGCMDMKSTTKIVKKVGPQSTVVHSGFQLPLNKDQNRADSYLQLIEDGPVVQERGYTQSNSKFNLNMKHPTSAIQIIGTVSCSTVRITPTQNADPATATVTPNPLLTKRCSFDLRTQKPSQTTQDTVLNETEAVQVLSMVFQEINLSSLFR